jgi:hypothetical protein
LRPCKESTLTPNFCQVYNLGNHTYPLQNKQNEPFLIGPILGCFSPIAQRPTKSTASRPTKSKATRTASPGPTSDAIRGTLRYRYPRSFMSELRLRTPTQRRTPFLIDNFGKSRAIRNHIQTIQNKQYDQILIDNFVDPLPRQLIHEPTGKHAAARQFPFSIFAFSFSARRARFGNAAKSCIIRLR